MGWSPDRADHPHVVSRWSGMCNEGWRTPPPSPRCHEIPHPGHQIGGWMEGRREGGRWVRAREGRHAVDRVCTEVGRKEITKVKCSGRAGPPLCREKVDRQTLCPGGGGLPTPQGGGDQCTESWWHIHASRSAAALGGRPSAPKHGTERERHCVPATNWGATSGPVGGSGAALAVAVVRVRGLLVRVVADVRVVAAPATPLHGWGGSGTVQSRQTGRGDCP